MSVFLYSTYILDMHIASLPLIVVSDIETLLSAWKKVGV